MDLSANVLSICSGYGGLDLGVRIARPEARTVCYVERELTAAAILAARMEDGTLDEAPVWSDLRTFDGKRFRGLVDILLAGYPCQPFSNAGKRQGNRDPRHLWPHVARVTGECEPEEVFLENVDAHLRLGFREVCRKLERMGYRVAAGLFSAEEVGAPHRRLRLFALADRNGKRQRKPGPEQGQQATNARCRGAAMADAGDGFVPLAGRRPQGRTGSHATGEAMEDAYDIGRRAGIAGGQSIAEGGRRESALPGEAVGKPAGEGYAVVRDGRDPEAQCASALRAGFGFCPGPDDLESWRELLHIDATLKPALCRASDGTDSRVDRLRALGNGVVPLVAALAYRTLRGAHER